MDLLEIIRWTAAINVIAAALAVAWGEPPKLVAFGFLLFTVASVLWIAAAGWEGKWALLAQNAVLLLVNVWGLWRWTGKAGWRTGGRPRVQPAE